VVLETEAQDVASRPISLPVLWSTAVLLIYVIIVVS
jgi:hypothetical protein